MKIINIKILAVLLVALFVAVSPAVENQNAQAYEANHPPLLVVRFNQRKVSYRNQLFYAATEAVKTKPTVIFDVVAYAPVSPNGTKNARFLENAQYYGKQIADDLIKMGVNPAQVTFTTKPDGSLRNEEVKIFVR